MCVYVLMINIKPRILYNNIYKCEDLDVHY
jgi:hypothetical protein